MLGIEAPWQRWRMAGNAMNMPSNEALQSFVTYEGRSVELRRLRPDGTAALRRFTQGLSTQSKSLRFHVTSLSNETIERFVCDMPAGGGGAVGSWVWTPLGEPDTVVGEVRLAVAGASRGAAATHVELGIVIADAYQRQGIGLRSVQFVQALARETGVAGIKASVLPHNRAIIGLLRYCDFELAPDVDDPGTLHANWPRSDGFGGAEVMESGWRRLVSRLAGM